MPTNLHEYKILDDAGSSTSAKSKAPAEEKMLDSDEESNSCDDAIDEELELIIKEALNRRLPDISAGRGLYYAVRVGYAAGSSTSSEDDDDDHDNFHLNKKRKHEESRAASFTALSPYPKVKIRSAIFLHWEDVRQFVDTTSCHADQKAEWKAFDSFEEAEEYLIEDERGNASNVAVAAELSLYMRNETEEKRADFVIRKQKSCLPRKSSHLMVHQYPVSQGHVVPGRIYGGTSDMLYPLGGLFGRFFGMGGMGTWNNEFSMNNTLAIPATGQSVPISNRLQTRQPNTCGGECENQMSANKIQAGSDSDHGQSRETTDNNEKQNGVTIDGHSIPNENNTAPPKSKGQTKNVFLMNSILAIPTTGQLVPISNRLQTRQSNIIGGGCDNQMSANSIQADSDSNHGQSRETTDNNEKQNGVTTDGHSISNEGNTAPPKSKREKRDYWDRMYKMLVEYKDAHDGSIDILEGEEGKPGRKQLDRLRRWCNTQIRHQRRWAPGCTNAGGLTAERIEKLRDVGFYFEGSAAPPPESKGQGSTSSQEEYWDKMYKKLVEYKDAHDGSINIPEISEGEEDIPGRKHFDKLRRWCNTQIRRQRHWAQGYTDANGLTAERFEKLRELGFHQPSYDQMYEKLAAHKAETGSLDLDENDDEELYAWMEEQKKMLARHFQGKPISLSNEQIENLKSLGYDGIHSPGCDGSGVVDKSWDSMLTALVKYKEEHGSFSFSNVSSLMTKQERTIKYWLRAQRVEIKKLHQGKESSLTAQQLQRLNAVGLDLTPRPDIIPWEERMKSLRGFVSEHGHCKPNKQHPLHMFVSNMRTFYRAWEQGKPCCLTEERVNDLVEVGFVFKAGKTPNFRSTVRKTWDERFEELLAYKEEHGHTLVPQLAGPLGVWVKQQRTEYRNMKAGRKTPMTAEKALRLKEIGFHFDAERFKGRGREVE